MRTETEEIRDNLKYLSLLARDYPSQAAAASEIISTEALLKLPKGTEHFMSDLHGENEAFVHILNSASGVIREKVDIVLGDTVPESDRAELATLIYYPNEKLPQLKAKCADEEALAFACGYGADTVISSDFKHHVVAAAREKNKSVIILTHYASENYGFENYYRKIRKQAGIPCVFHTDEALL